MFYNDYYWGMNFVWWFIWFILIIWIFAFPCNIPGQRYRKDSSFDILRKRFASGEITLDEYNDKKKILEGA